MLFHPADFDGPNFVLSGDSAEERPEPFTQRRGDERPTFFGAENTMKTGTDAGHGIHSAVPSELMQFRIFPALKRRAIFICPCGTLLTTSKIQEGRRAAVPNFGSPTRQPSHQTSTTCWYSGTRTWALGFMARNVSAWARHESSSPWMQKILLNVPEVFST